MLKSLIPRIYKIRAKSLRSGSYYSVDDKTVKKSTLWWKNDSYTKSKSQYGIRWLGMTLFKFNRKQTIEGNYWKPAKDTVKIISEMQKDGIVSLDSNSVILEPGCNVGKNLYYLQEKFDCEVIGLDISEKALEVAKQKWKKRNENKYAFYSADVLNTVYFDSWIDNSFDLVITRWHLIHLPRSEAKTKYIESLKRIAKTLVIFEPVSNRGYVELYHDKTYCLSWDNWEDYGLKKYKTKYPINKTEVFYVI